MPKGEGPKITVKSNVPLTVEYIYLLCGNTYTVFSHRSVIPV